ncbi:MAG: hypothetical protein KAV83_06860 [Desulfobacterales bacterium]|nr:hypothetical protein [Desulfobacterales bacterium]
MSREKLPQHIVLEGYRATRRLVPARHRSRSGEAGGMVDRDGQNVTGKIF